MVSPGQHLDGSVRYRNWKNWISSWDPFEESAVARGKSVRRVPGTRHRYFPQRHNSDVPSCCDCVLLADLHSSLAGYGKDPAHSMALDSSELVGNALTLSVLQFAQTETR